MTKNAKILEIVITKKTRQRYLSNFFCITLEPPIIQFNKLWSEQMKTPKPPVQSIQYLLPLFYLQIDPQTISLKIILTSLVQIFLDENDFQFSGR